LEVETLSDLGDIISAWDEHLSATIHTTNKTG
jgi:hypothetical protein